MLVLTRKIGESVQIGANVTIEVLEMQGSRVRLGINAPLSIGVHRSELLVEMSATGKLPIMRSVPSIQRPQLAATERP